jgi:hypothetical protein
MRRWGIVVAIALGAVVAGCSSQTGATTPHQAAPVCEPRAATGTLTGAKAAAISYVDDIAMHRYEAAGNAIEPCNRRDDRAVHRLWDFMAGLPAGQAQVHAQVAKAKPWPGSATVDVTVFVRFGNAPYTAWIKATERTLRLDSRPGGWRVTDDVTTDPRKGRLTAYGFGAAARPEALSGDRATVVYSAANDRASAETILKTADGIVGTLWREYGGGRAAQRPVLFLVDNRRQAERLAHIQLGIVRTPAGFQYSSYAYVDLTEWAGLDSRDQQSMIVHELTHVASRAWAYGAPHSLAEGVAMYEENRWRLQHHYPAIHLVPLRAYYRQGFPSLPIWEQRATDWGLADPYAVNACYMDGMTMVQQIVKRHGGVAALKRLGQAFTAMHAGRQFAATQVETAFQTALGVSFEQVVREARASVGA